MAAGPASSKRAGRRRRVASAAGAKTKQSSWTALRNPFAPVAILSADEIESIHEASLTILETIGMDFLLPEAREILRRAGADIQADGERVRFDRGLVRQAVDAAPGSFRLHARNPAHDLHVGADSVCFCAVASAPNASDNQRGRRAGNQRDYRDFLRLGQSFNIVHLFGGYPVEPVDLHPAVRHLDCLRDFVTLTDKVFHAYSLGRERIADALEITRIGRGVSHEQMEREPSLFTIINSSSPLRLDAPMLQGIIDMASHNQVVVLTPFTLAGAMAPVTLAGALAQQNAEALAGLVLAQTVRRGSPFVYGGFTSNVDMHSGAPAFGTPEYMKAALAGGQLARRYGVPYRSSNVCAANAVDAQAAYESVFSLWGAIMGGVNLLMHGAGWMEGGLCASFEKFVVDAELLQTVAEFLAPLPVDEASLALDALRDVGPGGHFFGHAHTQARYRDAFYAPLLSDWRNFEAWREAGSPDTAHHAHELYQQVLAEYAAPPLDEALRDELDAFVERRKAEGGVPTDF
jgi:trimethylamine--corrinoid protein Co-methyltransferase